MGNRQLNCLDMMVEAGSVQLMINVSWLLSAISMTVTVTLQRLLQAFLPLYFPWMLKSSNVSCISQVLLFDTALRDSEVSRGSGPESPCLLLTP